MLNSITLPAARLVPAPNRSEPVKAADPVKSAAPDFRDYCVCCGDRLARLPFLSYSDNQQDTCFLCREDAEQIEADGETVCRCCGESVITTPGFCSRCLALPGGVGLDG